ncbi:T9SS type A sorting domain-containing protein [Maribacter sp. ACAM166]|uniref:T9SS type A sorting domain-containing protein n=1 Tax=Maribacter sp. ACAM166 TaxID=2508996 RepID=UPI001485024F|nr:T9SS type A sorting domain-containing protein [Maribacter sp. ACAM166]
MNNSLNKLIVLFFTAFMVIPKGYAQNNADPGIAILMSPSSVSQGSTGILIATVGNYSNQTIVENSLRVTISVGANTEIIGIASGSDTRWSQLSLTTGSSNTIKLTNSGGGFDNSNGGDILLTVRGNVLSDNDLILGNIVYIMAQNAVLCPNCKTPPLNTSQGNANSSNDNSQTSLAVICDSGLELDAGTDGALTICEGTDKPTEAELFEAIAGEEEGGVWTGPVAGVYTYTVTSECTTETDTSIVTVSESPAANAGTDGEITICWGTNQPTEAELFGALTGEDTGGTWSNVDLVYTYTIPASGACPGDTAVVLVTEVSAPNAGTDGTFTVCEGTTPTEAELFNALTGEDTGGTWSNVHLVYTYTIPASEKCSGDTAEIIVTEVSAPNAGTDGEISICWEANQPTEAELFASLTDADSGGTWSGPNSGFYTYSVVVKGICGINATAKVKVTVEQPKEPTTACYEIATFDSDNCVWMVSGTQPKEPTTTLHEKATFDSDNCVWIVTGTQPEEPTTECYEIATFDSDNCIWIVTGKQPEEPTTECYEIATFDNDNCVWIVIEIQPEDPITACYEIATFDSNNYVWIVSGTQPEEPITACYENATFDSDNCIWIVTGTQPEEPITACYENATFDSDNCVWMVTGTQLVTPTLGSVTQPTCETATGSFVISNYDASYTYIVSPIKGVRISGDTVIVPEGTYTVTTEGPHNRLGDCTSLGSTSITINSQIKCSAKFDVTLAENPSSDTFTLRIESMNRENLCIRIIDAYGKMIKQYNSPYKDIIKLRNELSPGLYFIEIRQGGERVILKALRL